VLLAGSLSIAYTSRGRELEALSRAFHLRDQLPELDRYEVAGAYYRATGDLLRAIEAFRGLQRASDGLYGHTSIGLCLWQAGDLAAAEMQFREGQRITDYFGNYEMLIRLPHRMGRRSEAWALLDQAERRYPNHPIFAELRIEMTAATGDHRSADSLAALVPLGGGVGLAERHPLRLRAVIHANRGRYAEALRKLDELRELQLARHMREPAINTTIYAGRLLLARDEPGPAMSYVERLLEQVPLDSIHALGRPYIQIPLADFFVEAGRPDRARSFLEAYDREIRPEFGKPGRARWYLVRAKLAAAAGETERALDELSRALRQVRVHGQFDFDLPIQVPVADRPEVARLYADGGRPDFAVAVYERYLANRALRRQGLDAYELAGALEHLAELYVAAGRPVEATRHYRGLAGLWDEADPDLKPRVEEALRQAVRLEAGA
jgi:tetratricopeptide (TPR) repeat protein